MTVLIKVRLYKTLTFIISLVLIFAILFSAQVRIARADDAGYALSFDGVNDVVGLAYTSSIMASTWKDTKTVELWFKPEGEASLCLYNDPIHCDKIFSDKPMWWGISRGIVNGQDRIWFYNVDSIPGLNAHGFSYTSGEWVHIAMVHSGGVLRVFLNGVDVGSWVSLTTQQPKTGAQPVLYLGGVIVTSARYYPVQGQIDEVRIWNVARTAEEIQVDMLHELAGDETGLAAYYRMSNGSGTTLTDDSINNWDGTLYDGGWGVPPNGTLPQWVPSGAFGAVQPTATSTLTPELPTATPTSTSEPPTATPTFTSEPPTNTPTFTPVPPTATHTFTPVPPTATATFTPVPSTATATFTPEPPTATSTPVPPGDAGYALSFDGVNDVVSLAYTSSMLASTWKDTKTVELWFKPEGEASVCPYNHPIECDKIFSDKPMWWGISRGIVNSQDRIHVYNVDGSLDSIAIEYTPGEWVHIAMVHGGGVLRAYKNGVEVGSLPSGTTRQPSSGAQPVLYIGGVIVNSTRYYPVQGQIDEVRLWNVARTAEEVQADMLHELAGDESGLAAYYRMSNGSGTMLTDDSINSWDGTLLDGCCGLAPNGAPAQWVTSGAFGAVQPAASLILEPAEATPALVPELPTATPTFTLEPPTATPTFAPELPTDIPTFTPEPPMATPTFTPEPPADTQELPTDSPTFTSEPPTPYP